MENNVSVVMVSYNTGPVLPRSIESVLQQQGLLELILVDNGNPREVKDRIRKLASGDSRLKIISGQGNIGFAAACNKGANAASGKYLLLLNPDCVIPKCAISKVRDELNNNPEAWVASCRIINPDGTEQSGSRRNLLTPWVAFVESFRLYRFFPTFKVFQRMNFHEMRGLKKPYIVPAISGAFMMIEKEKYKEIGGIDEDFFFHVEDLDFCYQINKHGGKILYVPEISAVHFRSTSDVSSLFVEWNKSKGFIHYFKKNFKGQFFPGFLSLLAFGIYTRFLMRMVFIAANNILTGKLFLDNRRRVQQKHNMQVKLLENYEALKHDGRISIAQDNISEYEPFLLAGATGQVGMAILRRLLALDVKIIALYHSTMVDFSHPNLTWVQGDLNTDFLNLSGLNPKTVIYTPALWLLPQQIEKFANMGMKRLIGFSSTSIFGKAASRNMYEQKLVASLIKAEKDISDLCGRLNIDWTIFRPTMIYGIGLDRNVSSIVRFIDRLKFFPVASPGTGFRQPVHCDDLALAVIKSLNNPLTFNKSYNLGGGEKISYREMVDRIYRTLGKRSLIISTNLLPLLLDLYSNIFDNENINGEIARRMNIDLVFDDSEAKNDFGYSPRKFLEAGLEDLGRRAA